MATKCKPVLEWWVDHERPQEVTFMELAKMAKPSWFWKTNTFQARPYGTRAAAKRAGDKWLKRYCSNCELVFLDKPCPPPTSSTTG